MSRVFQITEGSPFVAYRLLTGIFIPDCLIGYHGISAQAKICLCRLMRYAGKRSNCWPGVDKLAEQLNVSDRSVRAYLKELTDDGFIAVNQRGLGQTNEYTILKHRLFCEQLADTESASGPDRQDLADQEEEMQEVAVPDRQVSSGHIKEEESHVKRVKNLSVNKISDSFMVAFISNLKRPRGAPKVNAETRRRIAIWIESLSGPSEEQVLSALAIFQANPFWIEQGLYFHHFQKHFDEFLDAAKDKEWNQPEKSEPATREDAIRQALGDPGSIGAATVEVTHHLAVSGVIERVEEFPAEAGFWNQIVTSGEPVPAWNKWGPWQKLLTQARQNSQFNENLGAVLTKCQRLLLNAPEKNREKLTFGVMLKKWAEILGGDMNWMLHDFDKAKEPAKPAETVAEKMLRERREKKP